MGDDMNNIFGNLFGSMAPQADPTFQQYYDPKAAMWNAIGGGLQGAGAGLASGKAGAWAQGLVAGSSQGLENYKDNTGKRAVAAKMLEEADAKKQERARGEEERKRKQEYIKQFPADVQVKMLSIPGYMEKYIEATDPAFQQAQEAPASVREYQYAQQNGFTGSFADWVNRGNGSAGDAPTTKTIFDPESGQEQVVQWNGADWVPLGGKKSTGNNRSSATELKELWKSEDELPALDSTIDSLKTALDLNKKTFTGVTAGVRGYIGTAVPGGSMIVDKNAAAATREFGQLMTYEAIKSMAQTLAGATTDRELNQFVEILANPSTPPEIRERTINRMLSLADRQKQIKTQRVKELRGPGASQPASSGGIPEGVTPDEWAAMTEEERAVWQ